MRAEAAERSWGLGRETVVAVSVAAGNHVRAVIDSVVGPRPQLSLLAAAALSGACSAA